MKVRIVLVFVLLAAVSLSAQTFRGTILGTVTDAQGAVVAGAKVTVKNAGTGLERTIDTGADGSYTVPELPIGTYTVTVALTGFQTFVVSGVTVDVAGERRINAAMKPGQVATQVEVSGESLPQVETTTDTLGGQFEEKQIVDLPINGRDYTKMLIMVPGTAGEPHGAGDSPGSYGLFSANGSRGRANNFLLDGTDMNDGYRNLPAINQGGVFGTPGTVLPLDAVAELKILSDFEAEYGRNSGAVVNIVTKSGTNNIHGTAYEDFRNSALNARNYFNFAGEPKDGFRNNQFGGALGGPIVKDKTFFYAAYEGQREGLAITSLNVVPTLDSSSPSASNANDYAQAIATIPGGDPSQCATTILNCIQGQPAGVINPVILNFYNFCQTHGGCSGGSNIWPTVNVANALPGAPNSADAVSIFNNIDSVILKIDQSLSVKNQLSGRYFFGNSKQSFPLGLAGGNNLPATNTVAPIRAQLVSISFLTVVKPNQTNEARFGWNRYRNGFFPADAGVFGNPEQSMHLDNGVSNPNDYGLPTFRFGELSALGSSPYSNPRNRVDTNWQFFDNYSLIFGKHNLKVGYEFRRTSVNSFNDFSTRGVLVFNNLSDFLQGTLSNTVLFSSRQQVGNTTRNAIQNGDGLYIQDSIHLNSRVTVNAGLRWDYYGVIHETHGLLTTYDPAAGVIARSPLYGKDLNNFAPRLSVAWDVSGKGKTVIRSGFGVFYDDFSQDAFTGQIYLNSFNIGTAYNPVPNAPVQILKPNRAIPLAPDTPIFINDGTSDVSSVPNNMRTPYIYNYNLNVQQQLFRDTTLQVGYVGSMGRKLLRVLDLNQPTQTQITAADNLCNCINDGTLRKFSNLANMSSLEPFAPFYWNDLEAAATSNYNSLQVSLAQHSFHGLTNQIAYTWAHSIDTASDSQDYVPNAAFPQNSNNVPADKGPSNFDVRNRLVWSGNYDFPKWKSLGKMGSGWSAGGVLTVMSGHPFSMNYNFIDDYSGGGEFYDRPDIVGPIQYNYGNPSQFLNLNSFQVPCNYNWAGNHGDGFADSCQPGTRHYGDMGRNSLVGPNYRNFDFVFSKNTALTERLQLLFRADIYNLTNHPNFTNPLMPAFFADAAPNRSAQFPTGIDPVSGRNVGFMPITATTDVGIGNPVLGGGGQRSVQFSVKLLF
jgi:outer membrane receptor protein involved in Fe transport